MAGDAAENVTAAASATKNPPMTARGEGTPLLRPSDRTLCDLAGDGVIKSPLDTFALKATNLCLNPFFFPDRTILRGWSRLSRASVTADAFQVPSCIHNPACVASRASALGTRRWRNTVPLGLLRRPDRAASTATSVSEPAHHRCSGEAELPRLILWGLRPLTAPAASETGIGRSRHRAFGHELSREVRQGGEDPDLKLVSRFDASMADS